MKFSNKTQKSIAILTMILTSGGLDRQIISMCDFFVEYGYNVYIYSLLPEQQLKTLVKPSKNVVIIYPKKKNRLPNLLGLVIYSPILIKIFIRHFKDLHTLRKKVFKFFTSVIREKYILDNHFSDIYTRFKDENNIVPFECLIGFSYQTIPYLSRIRKGLNIDTKYIEISSPKWRGEIDIDEPNYSKFLENIDDIIVPSQTIGDELLERYSLKRSYSIIPLFLHLTPLSHGTDNNIHPLHFGLAARLSPEKNQDLLVKIMQTIKNTYHYGAYKLILVGSGPTEKKIRNMVEELDLIDNVIFLGHVEKVHDFIEQIGVVVLLSDVESVSATLLESLYYGKPIIATDVGSTHDLVIDGFNGFLIKDKTDIDEIAKKIIAILSDEKKYNMMSKNSRAIYDMSYSQGNLKLKEFFGF